MCCLHPKKEPQLPLQHVPSRQWGVFAHRQVLLKLGPAGQGPTLYMPPAKSLQMPFARLEGRGSPQDFGSKSLHFYRALFVCFLNPVPLR